MSDRDAVLDRLNAFAGVRLGLLKTREDRKFICLDVMYLPPEATEEKALALVMTKSELYDVVAYMSRVKDDPIFESLSEVGTDDACMERRPA